MRATALFMPTVKEDPADAEALSHKLMVRGGFIRQFASGIYIMLPLGWRVIQRICRIIREEMDAIGAIELSMPTLHPAELWQATGRYQAIGQEMFRLKDRGGRDMVLAMTHEEVFAWLASRELRSYRDLPQIWYQLQLKFRDEPRPKGGLLRVREFLMKDSYSFDLDEAGLEESYRKHISAYDRIFTRCGLKFYRVESDTGFMGGLMAHEYIAPSEAGEDRIVVCSACGYAANVEAAHSMPRMPSPQVIASLDFPDEPAEVATPDQRTIEEVSGFLGVPPWAVIKALVYVAQGRPVIVLIRGDYGLQENKLARFLHCEVRPAHPEEIQKFLGTEVGFVGPVGWGSERGGRGVRLVADDSLSPEVTGGWLPAFVTGANKPHTHLLGVVPGRDFQAEYADLREVQAGDNCSRCGAPLKVEVGIEIGNIFKLGTKYTAPLQATVLDESGRERLVLMGSYGIGPARIAAAAAEQCNDEHGIVWPKTIAPFDVHLVQVQSKDPAQTQVAAALHDQLTEEGWEVLWDDREERVGSKFADADLIGCPIRIVIGKKLEMGRVEVGCRGEARREEVPIEECAQQVRKLWEDLE